MRPSSVRPASLLRASAALWQESREEQLDPKMLLWFSGTALFLFVAIAYVCVGWGTLFGLPLVELLGIELFGDSGHPHQRHASLLFAMWACLTASLELLIVTAWLRVRR